MVAPSQSVYLQQMVKSTPPPSPDATLPAPYLSQSSKHDTPQVNVDAQKAPAQPPSPGGSDQFAAVSAITVRDVGYQCYQVVIGLATLVLGFISLLIYTLRSYKLAVWAAHNDLIQTCAGLAQV